MLFIGLRAAGTEASLLLSKLVLLMISSWIVDAQQSASSRSSSPTLPLQTTVPGIPLHVEVILGAPLTPLQGDGSDEIEYIESFTGSAFSLELASMSDGLAEYEIYLSSPSPLTGDITILLTVQLGDSGTTPTHWTVDLYEWDPNEWVYVGDLTGATTSEFRTLHLVYATDTPIVFQEPSDNEFLIRLKTEGATGEEVVFVDAVSITTAGVAAASLSPAQSSVEALVEDNEQDDNEPTEKHQELLRDIVVGVAVGGILGATGALYACLKWYLFRTSSSEQLYQGPRWARADRRGLQFCAANWCGWCERFRWSSDDETNPSRSVGPQPRASRQ